MTSSGTPKKIEQTQIIRAAVLRKQGGPLKMESLEMDVPRDDEILVRIAASGICHTDIRYIDDWYDKAEGALVLGHEGAGSWSESARRSRACAGMIMLCCHISPAGSVCRA